MTEPGSQTAFFLWVGSPMPDMARVSALSAAEAGFDTVLFTDRSQDITHTHLRQVDWRETGLPWGPDDVRLKGRDTPYFAGFADLFRYSILAQENGWWFDCDTIILRQASDFAQLLQPGKVLLGLEDTVVINNAVIGSLSRTDMASIRDAAIPYYPIFDRWGVTGPSLVTGLSKRQGELSPVLVPPKYFYPVHHNDIAQIYLPEYRETLEAGRPDWFCLSLWGEVLSRSGLKHLAPPADSLLGRILAERPELGGISCDPAGMARYLAGNLGMLDRLDSGSVAMRTLLRKGAQRVKRLGGQH